MEKKTKNEKIRIAKLISNSGLASRREAEKLILEKRVTLYGEVIDSPALNVDRNAIVTVDGEVVDTRVKTRVWIFNKPKNCLVTKSDPKNRDTIYSFLPKELKNSISVGRLDYNSEGLLILTNNGDLSRYLELPKNNFKRSYKVRVFGKVDEKRLKNLSEGISIKGEKYKPIDAVIEKRQNSNAWLKFSLYEGKNREIRKICNHMNLEVNRLIRYSYGPFSLGNLTKCGVKEISNIFLKRNFANFF